jgi:2-oxoglutarate ferredoxin oxidoreductase subunit gamma
VARGTEVRISGLGGQGVVLAGVILGRAVVRDGKYAIQTQSYGAEARGSAAKSEVIIADEQISFPKVRRCDILIAMSQSALDTHLKDLKENGILLVDGDMVKKLPKVQATVFRIPATKAAEAELKSRMYANVIMLGALTRATQIVSKEAIEEAISESVPAKTKEKNLKGFKIGYRGLQ